MRARWPGIAATYVGTVVGAGFASGHEVWHFFARYGRLGLVGSTLAGGLFAFLGTVIIVRSAQYGHRHYGALLRDVCGTVLGGALDRLGFVAVFVALAAVIACAGALGATLWSWHPWLGSAALVVLLTGSSLGGRRALVGLSVLAAPLIAIALLTAGVHALPALITNAIPPPASPRPTWYLSAVLYVAYNLVLALAGLCSVAYLTRDRLDPMLGGVSGGLGIGLLCAAATVALLAAPNASASPLPLSKALPSVVWSRVAYPAILVLSLWTTGAAAALALGQRAWPAAPEPVAAAFAAAAFPLALIGLGKIVATLYPLVGYTGLPLVVGLTLVPLRRRSCPARRSPPGAAGRPRSP